MKIAVASAWRNSAHRVPRYMKQIAALRVHVGPSHSVRVIAVEGDSTDNTGSVLQAHGADVTCCHHGGRWFGSTEAADRMIALSKVGNAIFDEVRPDDDVLVYVESDLLWDSHTIGTLIDYAMRREDGFDVFAPMVFAGECFYDVWAFRKNRARFGPFAPYHSDLDHTRLNEVDSAGSCLVMRGEVARTCRIRNDYCLVGWCENAHSKGFRVAVEPRLRITHP